MYTVTLQTIADSVHVSRSTVSRVLNRQWKENGISEATARVIIAKAQELSYIKNESARSLRAKRTFTVGEVVRDITNTFYAQIIKFIEEAFYSKKYIIIICNTNYDLNKESGHINALLSRKVDGIILSPVQKSIDNILLIKKQNVPLVLFDSKIEGIEADYVVVDSETGSEEAVSHLISLGHRKIAYIGGHSSDSNNQLRLAGYVKALSKGSIPLQKQYIKQGSYTFNCGHKSAQELLQLNARPTAFFAANNRLVLGVHKCVVDCGLHIPGDISIVGFDDFEMAAMLPSQLTVVRQPIQEISSDIVNLLLSRIEKTNQNPFMTKVLQTNIIYRSSTEGIAA